MAYTSTSTSAAFTIVELLIVIVVIAILATITVVAYGGIRDRASDAAVTTTAKQIEEAIQLNEVESGRLVTGDSATETRDEFLSQQGLKSLGGKIYISGYDESQPDYSQSSVNGSVTTYSYNKNKIYVEMIVKDETFYGNPPIWPWKGEVEQVEQVSISRWSNQDSEWKTVRMRRYEKSVSKNDTYEEFTDCAPFTMTCDYDASIIPA